jgi:hypothetical protein
MLHVLVGDCVDAAVVLRAAFGKRVALLNMASDSNPGGGWQSGAGAQEVNFVSNRSVLDMQIPNYQQLFYNFRTNKIIYHKSIDITHTHTKYKTTTKIRNCAQIAGELMSTQRIVVLYRRSVSLGCRQSSS